MGPLKYIKLKVSNYKWRKRNKTNFTYLKEYTVPERVTVGNGTYGGIMALMHNDNYKLRIGSYCSIAPEVFFIVESDHAYDMLSTFPFKAKYLHEWKAVSKGDITVCDDVWIGARSIILSGVTIG